MRHNEEGEAVNTGKATAAAGASDSMALVMPHIQSAIAKLQNDLPNEFEILISDLTIEECSSELLHRRMSELDTTINFLAAIGYSCQRIRDARTEEYVYLFKRHNGRREGQDVAERSGAEACPSRRRCYKSLSGD